MALQTINARFGRVRRETLNGRDYLVAPFVSLIILLLATTTGLGSLPNVGSLTSCPAVYSAQGSLQGETSLLKPLQKYGVYCLLNTKTRKRYVGSGSSKWGIELRRKWHYYNLRNNKHRNRHLQRAWNKYGEKNFKFIILEACAPSVCIAREQVWIDHYRAADLRYGYNISPTAGNNRGVKLSKETRKRISEILRNRPPISEETRRKRSESLKGHPVSAEIRAAISRAQTGRKHTEEHKRKVSEASKRMWKNRSRTVSNETRARMKAAAQLRGLKKRGLA